MLSSREHEISSYVQDLLGLLQKTLNEKYCVLQQAD